MGTGGLLKRYRGILHVKAVNCVGIGVGGKGALHVKAENCAGIEVGGKWALHECTLGTA
jgi:hypothetical protein